MPGVRGVRAHKGKKVPFEDDDDELRLNVGEETALTGGDSGTPSLERSKSQVFPPPSPLYSLKRSAPRSQIV